MGFDGSSITGFNPIEESDMLAVPDPATFELIPWRPSDEDLVARMFCDIRVPGGGPYEGDPRWILRRAIKRMHDMGFDTFNVGPELEYFYFRSAKPENGIPEVLDEGGYFDLTTLDAGSDLRRETVLALEKMGIHVEYTHHEVGPSQHEVDMRYKNALEMADDCMTYRIVVKEYALKYGYHATFMPKPLFGENGSGMHVHQSLSKGGKNAFYDADDPYYLSPVAKSFIAGQLKHAREISPLFAQWVNSYKRLVPGYEAPVYLAWSRRNRSALIRVPLYHPGKESATRAELRCPDPAANPYLCFAAMLQAGLEGVEKGYELPEPMEQNLYHLTQEERSSRGSSSCRRPSARRSSWPPTRSWCCERWASTPSVASSRSSARNGTTTGSRSPRSRSKTSCRSSETVPRLHVLPASSSARTATSATRSGCSSRAGRSAREERQDVATDLGFPETVFVDDPAAGTIRIFTLRGRSSASHAGTRSSAPAWLLANEGEPVAVLRPPAGEVEVRHEGELTFVAARAEWSPPWELEQLSEPIEVGAVEEPPPGRMLPYYWAWEDEEAGTVRARCFSVEDIGEDEATGSAAIMLAAAVERDLTIRQGRGSLLFAGSLGDGAAEVGGLVVLDEIRDYAL